MTDARLTPYTGPDLTVTFEDHGQDFLRWDIKDGKVVDSQPFQFGVWGGLQIYGTPETGKQLFFNDPADPTGKLKWIKYPLIKVKVKVKVKVKRLVANRKKSEAV